MLTRLATWWLRRRGYIVERPAPPIPREVFTLTLPPFIWSNEPSEAVRPFLPGEIVAHGIITTAPSSKTSPPP